MLASATNDLRRDALLAGRSEPFLLRVAERGMERFPEQACLLEQKFIKDASVTIHELLESRNAALKEKLRVVRFARFSIHDLGAEEG